MSRERASKYANSLQRNISLYFPFLAYYQISYYKSSLFDVTAIGRLVQNGFPAEVKESLGESWWGAHLTLNALVSTALIAADPEGLSPRSTWLIANSKANEWLSLDWQKELNCTLTGRFCWPIFGALALLRDTAYSPAGFCTAATSFSHALHQAVQSNEAIPLQLSLDFLQEPESSCGEKGKVLRAAAMLAVADWARRAAMQKGGVLAPAVQEGVQEAVGKAQSLLMQVLEGDVDHLGLGELSTFPGGSELFWILDRLQCAPTVDITGEAHRFWMGAENVGMRNDVKISYQLFVFPFRELVSDFVRARKVPYCNESILRVVQTLARHLHRTRAHAVHAIEIGANLGDCSLWLAKRMQAVPSLRRIKVLALEAVPQAAAVFQKSVEWNSLTDVIQVVNVAAGRFKGNVSLQAKPMSSNSYTLAAEGFSSDFASPTQLNCQDKMRPDVYAIFTRLSHTNGQELPVLRGAMRILRKSPHVMIILQLYGPESGVIRDPSYDPCRPVRWLAHRGFEIYLSHRKGLRLETPGVLRRYFEEGQQVVNVIAVRRHQRRLLSEPPVKRKPRTCLDLSQGEHPNSWAEVDGRVLRENLHIVRIYLESHFANPPPIGAVLKANAYGHGAVLAGRVLASAKIDALFVSEAETGLILRMAPEVPRSLPMLLLYRSPGWSVACKLASANITVSVLSMAWLHQARRWPPCNSRLRLHIMVDTGLNREGLSVWEISEATKLVLQKWPSWSLDGFYTHWCCVYNPAEMHHSLAKFEHALGLVQDARRSVGGVAGNQPLTVHTSSSSSILFGVHYDLLRIGGLLFGDPVAISNGEGGSVRLPGPHRTLLWKSKITALRWSVPGERFSRCTETSGCEHGPVFDGRHLLGTIPVGAYEFSDSNIVSSHFREKLRLLEKSTESILVEIPRTSRTFRQAFEGMEATKNFLPLSVLLCAENCVQGLFNVPEHVPRILVQDPSIEYAPSGDSFYPVELNGAIFDSFNLRVVFERDKTGFEESKEFPIRTNTVVAARYQIIEYLGSAAFSRAVQCLDLDTNKMVCMKIIKNDKDFFDQSLDEIKLLKYINCNGNVDHNHVLRLYDHFYHKEHLIIVTELLRDNLYEFSKYNRECGDDPYFTMGRLQKISKQILTALEYVHSLRLIHCDLKPENILIKSYSRCEVKVIDFGSSCFVDDHLSSYVQSRSYRAPEVMLGLPYSQKIDLWSLGCIIAELWTGYVLFQNDSVQSLLARILGIIGDFPYHLMTSGKYVPQYFTQDGQLYQEIEGQPCPERGRRLHLLVPKKTSLRQRMRTDDELFLDFLSQLLQLDPTKRPGAAEASQHPFLTPGRYQDGLDASISSEMTVLFRSVCTFFMCRLDHILCLDNRCRDAFLGWSWTRRGRILSGHVLFEEPRCESKGWPEQAKILGQGRLLVTLVSYMCGNKRTSQVLGTEADYYVAEAQRDGGDDDPDPEADPPGLQPSLVSLSCLCSFELHQGQGANQFTYFVTNDLAGEWRKLPDIKPKEIVAARSIKRLLTGNAGSKVITHPFFDGKEEIARITADTIICPKGFLKKEDEESPIEQNEEFVCPPSSELQKKEAWMHMQPHLLLSGRTVHPEIPEGDTDEEIAMAAKMKEEQAADPAPEIIRGLHEDNLQWSVKQAGDATMYRFVPDPAAPLKSSAVVYVRSLSWPGAVCAIRNGQWVNIYVGYGLAAVTSNFFPMAPPDVQDEPEDPGEVEEPQGSLEEPPAAED
eukprot:symbB.v1.2.004290.t1/scaffold220.1/size262620/14